MHGKVVVITGANSGIGKETAVALAGMGATTVLACRNPAKAESAAADIRTSTGSDDVHTAPLDLADLASVRACADQLRDRWDHIDILINNAGGIWSSRSETAQGFEQTFGVNHIGPFYLTTLLLDHLRSGAAGGDTGADTGADPVTEGARIVNLSSFAHHGAVRGMPWDDLQSDRRYSSWGAYSRSKLANLLFTRGLASRLDPKVVTANAVHPGPVRSGFGMDGDLAGFSGWGNRLFRRFEITATAGAATVVYLAASPEVEGRTGGYYAHSKLGKPSKHGRSAVEAERLWAVTEDLIRQKGFDLP
jgi:NAD(P)-dependent dehydrogenase (short-subunit alcohol dehydrogenase family)